MVSAENNPIIKAFVQDQAAYPGKFNSHISRNDEMYLFALQHFGGNIDHACIELLTTGKQSIDVIRQIVDWNFGGFQKVSAFLDFASGYGRLTRFLIQELSPSRVWVSDIQADAIKFQQEQFSVHGKVSVRDPKDFRDDNKYDCIFAASLFSHLPEKTFVGWLRRLYDLLTPDGLLIFSVHDAGVLPPNLTMAENGLLFIPESESRSLEKNDYGLTYVTESFVRRVIEEVTGKSLYYRMKKGLWWFQDIYIIPRNPDKSFDALDISPGPVGSVDRCRMFDDGGILFKGWAFEPGSRASVQEIQIVADGEIVCRCLPYRERPDIVEAFHDARGLKSGFFCYLEPGIIRSSDIVIVKIINSKNIEHVISIGTLESMMK